MFYRIISVLLSVCMVTGGTAGSTYGVEPSNLMHTEIVTQTEVTEEATSLEWIEETSPEIMSSEWGEETSSEVMSSEWIEETSLEFEDETETAYVETTTEEIVSEEDTTEAESGTEEIATEEMAMETATIEEIVTEETSAESVIDEELTVKMETESTESEYIKIDKIEIYAYYATFSVTLLEKYQEYNDTNVYLFYREENSDDEWYYTYEIFDQPGQEEFRVGSVKADASYEYVIGISPNYYSDVEELVHTVNGTFRTIEDDRKISVEVEPRLDNASLIVSLTGKTADDLGEKNYIHYGVREKGSDSEEILFKSYEKGNGEGVVICDIEMDVGSYTEKYLQENTTYEYWVGVGNTYTWKKENLVDLHTGEFTTAKDERKLRNVEAHAGYDQAVLRAKITDNDYFAYSVVQFFYKKTEDETWQYYDDFSTSMEENFTERTITGLEQGKTYDYALILADSSSVVNPDDYVEGNKKVCGTFTTKECDYTLQIKQNTGKLDVGSAVLDVAATGTNKDSVIIVTLDVYNDEEPVTSVDFSLSQVAKYKSSVTVSGLSEDQTYNIKRAVISITDKGSKQVIGEIPVEGVTFKTVKHTAPTEMTASQEEVHLNAAYQANGYDKKEIEVGFIPANATPSYEVSGYDANVVNVTENDSNTFSISALKAGETEVIVRSDYVPDVYDSINVYVKNYVVAKKDSAGVVEIITGPLELSKGSITEEIGYYEQQEDGSLTLLEDVTVTSSDEAVVELAQNNNVISTTAKSVGTAYIEFEKDGFKNRLQVNVKNAKYYFGVKELVQKNSTGNYPSIKVDDNTFVIANRVGYTLQYQITPYAEYDASIFTWDASNSSLINGNWSKGSDIEAWKAGTTQISVRANAEGYDTEAQSITVHIKDTPTFNEDVELYAITNGQKNLCLKDVELSEELGDGWVWKYPDTPLYALSDGEYDVYYAKDDKYPREEKVKVNVITYQNLTVNEQGEDHRGVIQVSKEDTSEPDTMYLSLEATSNGNGQELLEYELETKKNGLTIESVDADSFKVTAQEAGNYTLTASAYIREYNEQNEPVRGEKILTATYKIKAVNDVQVRDILLTTDSEEFAINEEGIISSVYSSEVKGKTFTINAEVIGSDKNECATALEWSITDKSVATVTYDKKDSHKATITVKDDGNAVIKVKAKDTAKTLKELPLQLFNGEPQLTTSKVTVNLAYDYDESTALPEANNGQLRIINGHNNPISSVCLLNSKGELENRLKLTPVEELTNETLYLAEPQNYEIPTGNYKCTLVVKTANSKEAYQFPITVSVINKQPKITVKTVKKANLFYLNQKGRLEYYIDSGYEIESIRWTDNSQKEEGFKLESSCYGLKVPYSNVVHNTVKTNGSKLADAGCAKGTLTITVDGIRENVVIKNFKIGYTYKKPTIKLDGKNETTKYIFPDSVEGALNIKLYDPITEKYLEKVDSLSYTEDNYYHEIHSNNKNVDTTPNGSLLSVNYGSNKNKETITYTLDSLSWREPLKVKYTIKVEKPIVSLTDSTLVFNKEIESAVSTTIQPKKNQVLPDLMGVKYSGADKKSEELIKNGILEIGLNSDVAGELDVKMNQAKLMKLDEVLKEGTYTFKLTPYYAHSQTGETMSLNTLKLKLKVVDKPVKATVSVKGTLDLVRSSDVRLQAKFSNMDSTYQIRDAKLVGEFSEFFMLKKDTSKGDSITNPYSIKVSSEGYGKLKAGYTYKFTVEYTVQATDQYDKDMGDTFVVKSNVIKIKPKQSVPKVKLSNNNPVLYITDDELYPGTKVIVPSGYSISSVMGELDINKDGKADIKVDRSPLDGYKTLRLHIIDEKQIVATSKGKTYTIPITIFLGGRDGVSKNATAKMKVTFKR